MDTFDFEARSAARRLTHDASHNHVSAYEMGWVPSSHGDVPLSPILQTDVPTREWVIEHLSFVRLSSEVGSADRPLDIGVSVPHPVVEGTFDPRRDLDFHVVQPNPHEHGSAARLLSILMHGDIRRGDLDLIRDHRSAFLANIEAARADWAPIQIVLPSLPFKDQNPLTTGHSLSAVDLGEYLFMAQMRDICQSVHAWFQPGVRMFVLCDGLVYTDIFADGRRDEVIRYRDRCRAIRDELGLRNVVELVDMSDVVLCDEGFAETRRAVLELLRQAEMDSPSAAEAMRSLRRGMRVNMSLPGYGPIDAARLALCSEESLPPELRERYAHAALLYASFGLTMTYRDTVHRAFPRALRATVHPKNAPQLPLHLANRRSAVLPYNGVPWVSQDRITHAFDLRGSTRIVRLRDILGRDYVTEVRVPGIGDETFYYLDTRQRQGRGA